MRLTHITPNGTEHVLNNERTVFLAEAQGLGLDTAEPMGARVPHQHGVQPVGLYVGPKELAVSLRIIADTSGEWAERDTRLARDASALRHAAVDDHAPPLCTLRVEHPDGRTRDIAVWLMGYLADTVNVLGGIAGTRVLTYWAPLPLFYDPVGITETLTLTGGGETEFPITFPLEFPLTTIDASVYPDNSGETPTWPRVRLNGPGQDPTLENVLLGKTLELVVTMASGDYIDIDMGAATVLLYTASTGVTTDITDAMQSGSEFWPLGVGPNQIHVTMSQAYTGSVVFTLRRYFTTA